MALTTLDLNKKLLKYSQFAGVFAINQLPRNLPIKPFGIVINLDPSWKTGSHWTALYVPTHGSAIYFDSFGLRPNEDIILFIERNCKHGFNFNRSVYQGDLSIKCGYFCISFLISCFEKLRFPFEKCQTDFNEFLINKLY